MSLSEDFRRTADLMQQVGAQIVAQNAQLQGVTDMVSRTLAAQLAPSLDLLNESIRANVLQMTEPIRRSMAELTAPIVKAGETLLMQSSATIATSIVEILPKLVFEFPKIVEMTAPRLPPLAEFRPMLATLMDMELPEGAFSEALVDDVHLTTEAAVDAIEGPDREVIAEIVRELEEIRQAQVRSASMTRVGLTVSVLGVLFALLVGWPQIVERGFAGTATVGAALTHVWQYAAVLIALLLANEARLGD